MSADPKIARAVKAMTAAQVHFVELKRANVRLQKAGRLEATARKRAEDAADELRAARLLVRQLIDALQPELPISDPAPEVAS